MDGELAKIIGAGGAGTIAVLLLWLTALLRGDMMTKREFTAQHKQLEEKEHEIDLLKHDISTLQQMLLQTQGSQKVQAEVTQQVGDAMVSAMKRLMQGPPP